MLSARRITSAIDIPLSRDSDSIVCQVGSLNVTVVLWGMMATLWQNDGKRRIVRRFAVSCDPSGMTKIGQHTGYLVIDHRNSPGIPDELAPQVAAAGGVPVPGNVMAELDTWTCAHCGRIVLKNPARSRPREVCRKCMAVVCDACVLWCEPFAKVTEALLDGKLHTVADNRLILPGTY